MNANDILNVNVACVCVFHRRCFMCMGIREYNPLPIFFMPVRSFACLLYLSLRSHRSEANFTFCVFLSPTHRVRVRAYGILKFISFHWNGCHHKWIDFCRFVERIKNRFYAGFIMHWLYGLLRTIQCTSTRFFLRSAPFMAFCLILVLSLFGFVDPICAQCTFVRVYLCVMCIYLFTFTWPFSPCFVFFCFPHHFRSLWFYYWFSAVNWMICEVFCFEIFHIKRMELFLA